MIRFEIEYLEGGVLESESFHVSIHPSESPTFLVARVLVRAIRALTRGRFSGPGICVPEVPTIAVGGDGDEIERWIDVGCVTPKRIRRALKRSGAVEVFAHRLNPQWVKQLVKRDLQNTPGVTIYQLAPTFLEALARSVRKRNIWRVERDGDRVTVAQESGEVSSLLKMISRRS